MSDDKHQKPTPEVIQKRVLGLCHGGANVRDMARTLSLSENAVRIHCRDLVHAERLRADTSGKEIRYMIAHHLPNMGAHDPFGLAQGALS